MNMLLLFASLWAYDRPQTGLGLGQTLTSLVGSLPKVSEGWHIPCIIRNHSFDCFAVVVQLHDPWPCDGETLFVDACV